jgi:hydroxypyruvate isomerase
VPRPEKRFRSDFRPVVRYATALGARHLHVMAGAAEGEDARATFVQNLAWVAAEASTHSLTLVPINRHDMPG